MDQIPFEIVGRIREPPLDQAGEVEGLFERKNRVDFPEIDGDFLPPFHAAAIMQRLELVVEKRRRQPPERGEKGEPAPEEFLGRAELPFVEDPVVEDPDDVVAGFFILSGSRFSLGFEERGALDLKDDFLLFPKKIRHPADR